MSLRLVRWFAAVVLVVTVVSIGVAGAQPAQTPSTFPRPNVEPTAEGAGPESTAGDLRFAQVGLIVVAVVGTAMVVAYWRHTGREARLRHRAAGADSAGPVPVAADVGSGTGHVVPAEVGSDADDGEPAEGSPEPDDGR